MRVLVVEDDQRVARLVERSLTEDGHAVMVAHDGVEGLDLARGDNFDALVLDVMLPRMDGFAILKTLRNERRATPVLMLTARDTMQDTVNGLNLGADDYLTKPFHIDVLLARVRAVSRRGAVPQFTDLKVGDLTLNRATHEVRCGGHARSTSCWNSSCAAPAKWYRARSSSRQPGDSIPTSATTAWTYASRACAPNSPPRTTRATSAPSAAGDT
jgi:DNA-binding response OmpR family regulator